MTEKPSVAPKSIVASLHIVELCGVVTILDFKSVDDAYEAWTKLLRGGKRVTIVAPFQSALLRPANISSMVLVDHEERKQHIPL